MTLRSDFKIIHSKFNNSMVMPFQPVDWTACV